MKTVVLLLAAALASHQVVAMPPLHRQLAMQRAEWQQYRQDASEPSGDDLPLADTDTTDEDNEDPDVAKVQGPSEVQQQSSPSNVTQAPTTAPVTQAPNQTTSTPAPSEGKPTPAPTDLGKPTPPPTQGEKPTPAPTDMGKPTAAPTDVSKPTPAPSSPKPSCIQVSVEGDATYCIQGPICSGSGPSPAGTNCPVVGDIAVQDCLPKLPSYALAKQQCIAPVAASCQKIKTGAWGCVWTPVTPAPSVPLPVPTPASSVPTKAPTQAPTQASSPPTQAPTPAPSVPTQAPTPASSVPTQAPTKPSPSTEAPTKPLPSTAAPTTASSPPTQAPTPASSVPTQAPTKPSPPTEAPTKPSSPPTQAPTPESSVPTQAPTKPLPSTEAPTQAPTGKPTPTDQGKPGQKQVQLSAGVPVTSSSTSSTGLIVGLVAAVAACVGSFLFVMHRRHRKQTPMSPTLSVAVETPRGPTVGHF